MIYSFSLSFPREGAGLFPVIEHKLHELRVGEINP